MALAAGGLISLTLIALYVFHARTSRRTRLVDEGLRQSEYLSTLQALGEIHAAITALPPPLPHPDPPDFTFLTTFVAEQSRAIQARMDTINSDMAILTTRVETGPGKRTINFP